MTTVNKSIPYVTEINHLEIGTPESSNREFVLWRNIQYADRVANEQMMNHAIYYNNQNYLICFFDL